MTERDRPMLFYDSVNQAGRRIVAIDDAIDSEIAQNLFEYVNEYAYWGLNTHETTDVENNINDNVPFIHSFHPIFFEKSPLWMQHLEKQLKSFWGNGFVPYDCSVNNGRFGDNPLDHRDSFDPDTGHVTMVLYLNPTWNINHGGETVFFSETNEIEFSLLPKFCRMILFDSYINHSARPPSRLFHGTRYTLAVKLKRVISDENNINEKPVVAFSRQLRFAYLKKTLFG